MKDSSSCWKLRGAFQHSTEMKGIVLSHVDWSDLAAAVATGRTNSQLTDSWRYWARSLEFIPLYVG